MKSTGRAWLNLAFSLLIAVVHAFSALGYMNGQTQADVTAKYEMLITPVASTFSIWAALYLLLVISSIVQIVRSNTPYHQAVLEETAPLYWLSCLLGIAWLVLYAYEFIEIAALLALVNSIVLAFICRRLLAQHVRHHWLLPMTYGTYAGWMFTVAVRNITAVLVKNKWDGLGLQDDVWAMILAIFNIVMVILILTRIRNAFYPLPIAWTFVGTYLQLNSPIGYTGNFSFLQNIILAGMVSLIALSMITYIWNRWGVLPRE